MELYGTLTVPFGSDEIVRLSDCDVMLMLNAALAIFPRLSCACSVKTDTPCVVGEPEMTPAGDSVKPAGNTPESRLNVYGAVPPVAANAVE